MMVRSVASLGSHTALNGDRYLLKSWLCTSSRLAGWSARDTLSQMRMRLSAHVVMMAWPVRGLKVAAEMTRGCGIDTTSSHIDLQTLS